MGVFVRHGLPASIPSSQPPMTPLAPTAAPCLARPPEPLVLFEVVFWLATLLPFFLFPTYLTLASQIAIAALFAISVDLILGYAGIVTLGHAHVLRPRRLFRRAPERAARLGRADIRPRSWPALWPASSASWPAS